MSFFSTAKTTDFVALTRLNLAVASRIYLLEPQWNPQLEQQAFGRAQRLGQTEQVTIIRYVMKDTVEDVIQPQTPLFEITWRGESDTSLAEQRLAETGQEAARCGTRF